MVLGPVSLFQRLLEPAQHPADRIALLDQLRRLDVINVPSTVRHVEAGAYFTVRGGRVSQVLPEFAIAPPQEPFADVVHNRNACSVQLRVQLRIGPKDASTPKISHTIALSLGRLPYAQVFEAKHTHASTRCTPGANDVELKRNLRAIRVRRPGTERRTKHLRTTTDLGRTKN